jgi:hypothetical protein
MEPLLFRVTGAIWNCNHLLENWQHRAKIHRSPPVTRNKILNSFKIKQVTAWFPSEGRTRRTEREVTGRRHCLTQRKYIKLQTATEKWFLQFWRLRDADCFDPH